jgi:hypothetical protein
MINPFKEVDWNPDLPARRKFALSLIIGFPCAALVFGLIYRMIHHAWKPSFVWLGVIGLGAGVVLWLLPRIAKPFYLVWFFFACCMGIVMGNLLFIVFFYLVFTPLGLALRATGRKAFTKGFDRNTPTYWRDAEKGVDLKRYYRQF